MKIYTCMSGFAIKYIIDGLSNAFRAAGHTVQTVAAVPPDFDLYLGHSGWNQNVLPPKNKRKGLVGIHVNPYGTQTVGSVEDGPVIDEAPDKIEWVIQQQPDFVWCNCPPEFIQQYYNKWTSEFGIPAISVGAAADTTIYYPRPQLHRFMCDVAWVGGKWYYKAKTMDKYLPPLISKYKCLIYGDGWEHNNRITDIEVPILFGSAKVCPSVSEPHTLVHPIDLPERPFKVIASGGFTVHTPSPAVAPIFGNSVMVPENIEHWLHIIEHYVKNDAERFKAAAEQRKVILDKHTYIDRCITIARAIKNVNLEATLINAKRVAILKADMRERILRV